EIIDEFPNFTYFLADLHPHVLAMPFVLLLIGAALNIYWSRNVLMNGDGIISWVSRLFKNEDPDVGDLRIVKNMARVEFWVLALVLGGLSFLNTWDFPIYTGLICLVVCLIAYEKSGWSWDLPGLFLETGVGLGIAGILFYIPFFLGFASQAGGFLPSLILFTRGTFFWMMFGPLLIPMIVWLVMAWMYSSKSISFRRGVVISLVISVSLWVLSYLFAFLISLVPVYGEMYMSASQGAGGIDIFMVIFTSLSRRLTMPGTWITLVILFGLVLVAVSRSAGVNSKHAADDDLKTEKEVPTPSADIFVLALMLMGLGLTLMPEFFFLRDQFGGRMNTIFKFYFQAWIVWGIAAAFCTVVLWSRWDLAGKIFKPISVLVLGAALVYPMTGFYQRAADVIQTATARNNIFDALTLDGAAYIKNWAPDEMEAIKWLRQAPRGIIVEAVGGSYTDYARYSTFSGQITVLGWPGHESQWRGGEKEKGNRESDIALLYRTNNWSEAQAILSRYQVRYIIVSQREITTYKITPDKFQPYLSVAYRNNSVTIYEVPVQITSSTLNGNN
ncbi:MAG: DUF2298 domain-containing protein, partial [Anaerolineae bacterium]|nr:DUF2298 domain-containing protein [Anaerolineae bacterium]